VFMRAPFNAVSREGMMQSNVANAAYTRKLSLDMWRPFTGITGSAHQGNRCGTPPEARTGGGKMIS
jgi:hypothetical protein